MKTLNYALVYKRTGNILRWFQTKTQAKAARKRANGYGSDRITALQVLSRKQCYGKEAL